MEKSKKLNRNQLRKLLLFLINNKIITLGELVETSQVTYPSLRKFMNKSGKEVTNSTVLSIYFSITQILETKKKIILDVLDKVY